MKIGVKKILMFVLPAVLLIIGGVAYMTQAEENTGLNSNDRSFILTVAEARMMDWAQGNLAAEKGTTVKCRQYGKRLMRDQDKLMQAIKELAASKNLVLPDELSEGKAEDLNRLKMVNGQTFDRRFRRMIIKDHKEDIYEFEKAIGSTDPEISDFAKRFKPIFEEHLEMARDLNK